MNPTLGWIWHQGGKLSPDPHASNRLKEIDPPTTAEGLRGWIGAYKFMAPSIPGHAEALEPLHKAVGDKSKSQPIEWDDALRAAFRTAKDSLDKIQTVRQNKTIRQHHIPDISTHSQFSVM